MYERPSATYDYYYYVHDSDARTISRTARLTMGCFRSADRALRTHIVGSAASKIATGRSFCA